MTLKKPLKITWISFLVMDTSLHKTSKIMILKHLTKRGHQVHLIAVRSKSLFNLNNSDTQITSIPLRYFPIITPIIFGLIMFIYLPFYIIKNRPNFIITDPDTFLFGFIWKPILSPIYTFKVILDIRSTPIEPSIFKRMNFNISILIAKFMFEGITIITSGMKKEVCEKYHINPDFIGVWSDAASPELFIYEKNIHYGTKIKKQHGLSGKFIIFYHGSLAHTRVSCILECIRAINLLKNEYPNIVMFLLGSGSAISDIKMLIKEYDLQDKIIIHKPVDYEEVPKYIALANVGIILLPDLPIWRNQCPLKLLEYLAMKRTVIVTNIKAHREIVKNNKCVIYVSSCNYALISKKIIYLYENRGKLEEWGKIGRTIIEKKYNWDKSAKDMEKYLLQIP